MRSILTFAAVLLGAVSFAQRSLPIYQVSLLRRPAVQSDLKLTGQQRSRVAQALDAAVREFQRVAAPGKSERDYSSVLAMRQKSVAYLTETQRRRFAQITLQYYGPMALVDPGYARKVGLNERQRKEAGTKLDKISRSFDYGPPKTSARAPTLDDMVRHRKYLDSNLGKVLTPRQLRTWNALLGKRIALAELLRPTGG